MLRPRAYERPPRFPCLFFQAALTALLQDNNEIKTRAADELRISDEVRSGLELRLAAANDALGAAEERLNALGPAARATTDDIEHACSEAAPLPASGALEPEENGPLRAELGGAREAAPTTAAAAATATREGVSELERASRESGRTRALAEAGLEEAQRRLRQEELEQTRLRVRDFSTALLNLWYDSRTDKKMHVFFCDARCQGG